MGNVIGYARVSTLQQKVDGNSLDVQRDAIIEKYPDAKIVEEAYTATKKGVREKFDAVIEELKAESDSTLVVYKLDRFARTVREGLEVIEELLEHNVVVDILNIGKIDNTPLGKLLVSVMLSIAEFEASQIRERCQEGKLRAKMTNPDFRDGRPPKYTSEQISHALSLLDGGNSYSIVSKKTGISVSTLTRAKRRAKAMVTENQE